MTLIFCAIALHDYFALATRSRQEGYSAYAEELDSLAREVVRHAVTIERRFR